GYIPWTTPPVEGHYCIQVLLEPPDDSNWLNNLGQRNMDVTQPHSPAQFKFAVGNHTGAKLRRVRFTVDCYTIPPLPACNERSGELNPVIMAGNSARGKASRPISRSAPPVPAGWTVTLNPSELQLLPGEEKEVTAQVTPPAGFKG